MRKLFLLEDDLSLISGLTFAFKKQGFALDTARTLAEAEVLWSDRKYDLLVLDVSLPDGSGFDFCQKVRHTSNVPILFLTASDEEMNIIMGLELGGDDYLTKPFKLGVLLSRVNALLRRANASSAGEPVLESGSITVRLLQGQAYKNGILLELTGAEYKLLCFFMQHPNAVLSKEQILDALWDCDGDAMVCGIKTGHSTFAADDERAGLFVEGVGDMAGIAGAVIHTAAIEQVVQTDLRVLCQGDFQRLIQRELLVRGEYHAVHHRVQAVSFAVFQIELGRVDVGALADEFRGVAVLLQVQRQGGGVVYPFQRCRDTVLRVGALGKGKLLAEDAR